MNSRALKYAQFVLIAPIVLRWFATADRPLSLIFISLLLLAAAEVIRQFFSVVESSGPSAPIQVFFFGLVYKDKREDVLKIQNFRNPAAQMDLRKTFVFAVIYIITLFVVRINTEFAKLGFLESSLFVLIISLWTACKTYRQLNVLLLFNFLITLIGFLNADHVHIFNFYVWLFSAFAVQVYADRFRQAESAGISAATDLKYDFQSLVKILSAIVLFSFIFKAVDAAIPQYKADAPGEEAAGESPKSERLAAPKVTAPIKNPNLPISPDVLHNLAKFNLETKDFAMRDLMDLQRIAGKSGAKFSTKSGGKRTSFEDNEAKLQAMRKIILKGEHFGRNELISLRALSKKIRGDLSNSSTSEDSAQSEDPKHPLGDLNYSRVNKIPTGQPGENDADEYLKARKRLADEIDSLSNLNSNNALLTEEERLKRKLEALYAKWKKFVIFILPIFLVLYFLLRDRGQKTSDTKKAVSKFTLSKKLRVQLKELYGALLRAKLSPRDEVLKSYYILELAFKEIDYGRTDDLPPKTYSEKLAAELPFIADSVRGPIRLFNRVFYGEKNPEASELAELRADMKKLMKKLQVV